MDFMCFLPIFSCHMEPLQFSHECFILALQPDTKYKNGIKK